MSLKNMKNLSDMLGQMQEHINKTTGFLANGRNYQIEQGSNQIKVTENFQEIPFNLEQFYKDWEALELEIFSVVESHRLTL